MMPQNIPHNLDDIKNTIHTLCLQEPSIIAAYIFGSYAKGNKRPKDIDLAILLDHKQKETFSLLDFITRAEKKLSAPVDVIVLNTATELLKFEVRRTGILIFERDSSMRKQFEVRSRKSYEDFLYLHRRYVKKVLYGKNNG
jgi:predicted nucleotidyltransferase